MTIEEKRKKDKINREKYKDQRKLAAWIKFKKQWENEQTKQTETA
jgi:hypothetical protein